MKISVRSHRAGFGLLGLAGLIALLAFLCAAVAISSSHSVAGSMRGIHRLQTQAAAEGAAVLLAAGEAETSGTIQVGECRVVVSPAEPPADTVTTGSASYRLNVEIMSGDRVRFRRGFRASTDAASGRVTVEATQ